MMDDDVTLKAGSFSTTAAIMADHSATAAAQG